MSTINRLSSLDTLQSSDQFPVYQNSQGDARRASLSVITAYLQGVLDFTTDSRVYQTQRSAPSATGFDVAITDDSNDTHLILTPVATYAAGTITLPTSTNLVDKQLVLVNCTQIVTTLTIAANGATAVTGAPTSLAANDYFTLKYDLATSTWYRVA